MIAHRSHSWASYIPVPGQHEPARCLACGATASAVAGPYDVSFIATDARGTAPCPRAEVPHADCALCRYGVRHSRRRHLEELAPREARHDL